MQQQRNKRPFAALLNDSVEKSSSSSPSSTTSSDYELLCEAIRLDRRRVAYCLLDKGCPIFKAGSREIPLHSAIEKLSEGCGGWTNIVLKLLYAGARVSDANANGDTALHLAFDRGLRDHVLDLLMRLYLEESHADAVNKRGLSVLHVACTRPKIEFVRELLQRKAHVNRRVHRLNGRFAGYTPLHIAVECGNHEVADLLLKRGAQIYAQNFNRSTPLHLACYRRDSRMIDLILAHDRVTANAVDNNGLSHFMVACTSKEPAFAKEHLRVADCKPWTSPKILLDSCTNNFADCQFASYTPLHFAAEFGSSGVFALLLARGARCCAMTGRMQTPLILADDKHAREHVARLFECYCKDYQRCEDASLASKSVVADECNEKVNANATDVEFGVAENFCDAVDDRAISLGKSPADCPILLSSRKRTHQMGFRLDCCSSKVLPKNKNIRER